MSNPQESQDMTKELFAHLVISLATSAMQCLGKIVHPSTGKPEVNLDAAQATIDMLDMLEAKTQGNLDAQETKFLKDTLTSLKLNYVETAQATPPSGAGQPAAPAEQPNEPKVEGAAPKSEGKESRYHKTYG